MAIKLFENRPMLAQQYEDALAAGPEAVRNFLEAHPRFAQRGAESPGFGGPGHQQADVAAPPNAGGAPPPVTGELPPNSTFVPPDNPGNPLDAAVSKLVPRKPWGSDGEVASQGRRYNY